VLAPQMALQALTDCGSDGREADVDQAMPPVEEIDAGPCGRLGHIAWIERHVLADCRGRRRTQGILTWRHRVFIRVLALNSA
jgi:hypothetical protein